MRGHIRKRGNKWAIVIDVGRTPDGERIRKWHSGYRTKRDAEEALPDLLSKVSTGAYVAPSKLTVATFLRDEWLPSMSVTIRPNTLSMYRHNIERHIVPAIGGIELRNLRPPRLNQLYADLLAGDGTVVQPPLAPRTVQIVHRIIRRALADAVRWGLVARNIADLADPPRVRTPEMKVWNPEQIRRFLELTEEDRLHSVWCLAVTTGMRRGELLGLRWNDVDLAAGRLSVVQSMVLIDHEIRFAEPKTAKSRRNVSLDARTAEILRAHRKQQLENRLAWGSAWQDTGLVFVQEDGSPLHPERVSKWFAKAVRASGLPPIRFHDLRHSSATAALLAGQPAKVVSERLGHSSIAMTLDTYSHVLPSMDEAAASAIACLIYG